jgi:hypothetical protein
MEHSKAKGTTGGLSGIHWAKRFAGGAAGPALSDSAVYQPLTERTHFACTIGQIDFQHAGMLAQNSFPA